MIHMDTFYGNTEREALRKIDIPDDKIINVIPHRENSWGEITYSFDVIYKD